MIKDNVREYVITACCGVARIARQVLYNRSTEQSHNARAFIAYVLDDIYIAQVGRHNDLLEEIAVILDRTVGTVRQSIKRADYIRKADSKIKAKLNKIIEMATILDEQEDEDNET